MTKCKICNKINPDPNQKFCSRKCRSIQKDNNKPKYKAWLELKEYSMPRVCFDYEGNSI
jgi:predicted nucleic acid-binding Zn ribbon protein